MKKSDKKPVTAEELAYLMGVMMAEDYDNEGAHCLYDDVLERYCLYPDITLAPLMEKLICEVRMKVEFWYA